MMQKRKRFTPGSDVSHSAKISTRRLFFGAYRRIFPLAGHPFSVYAVLIRPHPLSPRWVK